MAVSFLHPNADTAYPHWKRAIDLCCVAMAFPALALCTLAMAVMIKLRAPGPVFFRQERVGYRGKRFRLYKFRTMHVNAPTTTHQQHFATLVQSNVPMQKMDARGDSRLIPGGWLLRATGLDELPQIINVLRGEMSIVGPRPCIPYEYEQYSSAQKRRFQSLPGLTGLWQVSGKNRTTFERMVELDIAYADRRCPWLDLKIIFLTVPALAIQVYDTRRTAKRKARPAAASAVSKESQPTGRHARRPVPVSS